MSKNKTTATELNFIDIINSYVNNEQEFLKNKPNDKLWIMN